MVEDFVTISPANVGYPYQEVLKFTTTYVVIEPALVVSQLFSNIFLH